MASNLQSDFEMGMAKFKIEQGKYGKRMTLISREWSKELTEYFLSNDIKEVYLNIAFGWAGDDLSFLKDLKGLLALDILTSYVEDTSSIHSLTELQSLQVEATCKTPLDFSFFPKLEDAAVDWNNKVESLFQCPSLKELYIYIYKSKDKSMSAFSQLPNLEILRLKNTSVRSVGDISGLKKLKILKIGLGPKLESLEGLEALSELRILQLDTCRKIKRVDPIGKLKKLQELCLCGCGEIETLKPVANLKKLQKICFCSSTKILDGDMRVLLGLPKLKKAGFREWRHYNLKNKDMPGYVDPNSLRYVHFKKGNYGVIMLVE